MFRKLCLAALLSLTLAGSAAIGGEQQNSGPATESANVAARGDVIGPLDQTGVYIYRVELLTRGGTWVVESYHASYFSAANRADFLDDLGFVSRITSSYVPN
jgi:hypothetical protein